jgi:predicted transcriptional regulator
MTNRLIQYIERESLRRTFTSVAEDVGVDEKTIRNIFNAYTESLNNLIRVVNRVGRGYSFEALRAKMLFTEGFQKIKKPRYQHQRIPDGSMGKMPFYGVAENGHRPTTAQTYQHWYGR